MNFHAEKLSKQLLNVATRVRFRRTKSTAAAADGRRQLAPAGRKRSGRAFFASCIRRRHGYIANLTPNEYVALMGASAEPEGDMLQCLEERWLRGLTWQPLRLNVGRTPGGIWQTMAPFYTEDVQKATFLGGKHQAVVRVQLFLPPGGSAASHAGAGELATAGLTSRCGGHTVPLAGAKVTL